MARVTKESWKVFRRNMEKAQGLVKLQFYANDLINTGGKESVGKIWDFVDDMFQAFDVGQGMSLKKLIDDSVRPAVENEIISRLEERISPIPPEEMEKRGDEWLRKHEKELKQFEMVWRQLVLAIERVLLEQALVAGVTAFEVYIRDVTKDVVSRNRFIQERFTPLLNEKLNYSSIAGADYDLDEAIGEIVSRGISLYNAKEIRKHLGTLATEHPPISKDSEVRRLEVIFAHRHLIVHRAGLVDRQFIRQARYKGPVGSPVNLTGPYVEKSLLFLVAKAMLVQIGLEKERGRSVR